MPSVMTGKATATGRISRPIPILLIPTTLTPKTMDWRMMMNKLATFGMQLCGVVALAATLITATPAYARIGTLLKCDFVFTSQGYRYIGTYCLDMECKYVERLMFDSYCPFMRP